MRGQTEQSLIICFEELQDDKFSGLCEGAALLTNISTMQFGAKTIFHLENASNPYEMLIIVLDYLDH